MKVRILTVVLLALATAALAGEISEPMSAYVPTTSVMVLPPRNIGEGFKEADCTAFSASLAVTQGQLIKHSGGYWWVAQAGTTGSTGPTNTIGDFTSGTAILRRIPDGRRKGLCLVNRTDSLLYLSAGSAAVAAKGITLASQNSSWTCDGIGVPQVGIYAIAATASNLVTGVEW